MVANKCAIFGFCHPLDSGKKLVANILLKNPYHYYPESFWLALQREHGF